MPFVRDTGLNVKTLYRVPRRKLSPSQLYLHIGRIRIGDLTKLFGRRYGGGRLYVFPDDDAGREDLKIMLQHYSHTNPYRIHGVAKVRAPWMEAPDVWHLVEQVFAYPRKWRAATIGRELNVTFEEWKVLRLRTIKPANVSEKDLSAYRKEKDRLRQLRRRRKAGAKDRREYLAKNKISRTRPWERLGISRRTWYRQNKSNGTVAQVRPEYNLVNAVDEPVPSENRQVSKEAVRGKGYPLKSVPNPKSVEPRVSIAMTATLDLCQDSGGPKNLDRIENCFSASGSLRRFAGTKLETAPIEYLVAAE